MQKPKLPKLPAVEWAYRWIDILTYLDYPDDVRDVAFEEIAKRAKYVSGHPSTMAVVAVFMACEKLGIKFNLERADAIHRCYLAYRKLRPGLFNGRHGEQMLGIMRVVKKWRSLPV